MKHGTWDMGHRIIRKDRWGGTWSDEAGVMGERG